MPKCSRQAIFSTWSWALIKKFVICSILKSNRFPLNILVPLLRKKIILRSSPKSWKSIRRLPPKLLSLQSWPLRRSWKRWLSCTKTIFTSGTLWLQLTQKIFSLAASRINMVLFSIANLNPNYKLEWSKFLRNSEKKPRIFQKFTRIKKLAFMKNLRKTIVLWSKWNRIMSSGCSKWPRTTRIA